MASGTLLFVVLFIMCKVAESWDGTFFKHRVSDGGMNIRDLCRGLRSSRFAFVSLKAPLGRRTRKWKSDTLKTDFVHGYLYIEVFRNP